ARRGDQLHKVDAAHPGPRNGERVGVGPVTTTNGLGDRVEEGSGLPHARQRAGDIYQSGAVTTLPTDAIDSETKGCSGGRDIELQAPTVIDTDWCSEAFNGVLRSKWMIQAPVLAARAGILCNDWIGLNGARRGVAYRVGVCQSQGWKDEHKERIGGERCDYRRDHAHAQESD